MFANSLSAIARAEFASTYFLWQAACGRSCADCKAFFRRDGIRRCMVQRVHQKSVEYCSWSLWVLCWLGSLSLSCNGRLCHWYAASLGLFLGPGSLGLGLSSRMASDTKLQTVTLGGAPCISIHLGIMRMVLGFLRRV